MEILAVFAFSIAVTIAVYGIWGDLIDVPQTFLRRVLLVACIPACMTLGLIALVFESVTENDTWEERLDDFVDGIRDIPYYLSDVWYGLNG